MSVQSVILEKITKTLSPLVVDVINESHQHNVPANSETHFKLIVVSADFEEQSLVKRHQFIYELLNDELASGVHALALHLYTPNEWQLRNQSVAASPQCLGGSKS